MKVIFWDDRRETYKAVEQVMLVAQGYTKGANGRMCKVWSCVMNGTDKTKNFKQKDFKIERVEEEPS